MLTSELLRVRRVGGKLVPRYLRKREADRALELASAIAAVLAAGVGKRRVDLEAELAAITVPSSERVLALGLRKLLEDRAEFAVASPLDPALVRREVFVRAAARHRALELGVHWGDEHRAAVMTEVATALESDVASVEGSLYADLAGEERLQKFEPITPVNLVDRYNLSLAQGVLLKASKVVIDARAATPARYRKLFRALRFHGLLHEVERTDLGYRITVDGPFSLFDSVQKYGLRLAMFLPHVLALADFELVADVVWGKQRERATFELHPDDALAATPDDAAGPSVDLDAFRKAWAGLGSAWSVRISDKFFSLPGEVVCVPDLVFTSEATGEEVFLEVFGFWSRDAVFRRVDLLKKGLPGRVILAVPKGLRVSESIIDDREVGDIVLFRSTLSPRTVLDRLERFAAAAPAPAKKPRAARR